MYIYLVITLVYKGKLLVLTKNIFIHLLNIDNCRLQGNTSSSSKRDDKSKTFSAHLSVFSCLEPNLNTSQIEFLIRLKTIKWPF